MYKNVTTVQKNYDKLSCHKFLKLLQPIKVIERNMIISITRTQRIGGKQYKMKYESAEYKKEIEKRKK